MHLIDPPFAQTSEEGLTLVLIIVEHAVGSIEKLVERASREEVELNLVAVSNHAAEAPIAPISQSPAVNSLVVKMEVVVEIGPRKEAHALLVRALKSQEGATFQP